MKTISYRSTAILPNTCTGILYRDSVHIVEVHYQAIEVNVFMMLWDYGNLIVITAIRYIILSCTQCIVFVSKVVIFGHSWDLAVYKIHE